MSGINRAGAAPTDKPVAVSHRAGRRIAPLPELFDETRTLVVRNELLEGGALGIRVERPDDIAPALARALAANRPAIIDVATDIETLAPPTVS